MERLTGVYRGRYGIKTQEGTMSAYEMVSGDETAGFVTDLQKGIERLADYEDTGLTPGQIKELDKLYQIGRAHV